MKNSKGFTLIELLGVIVILAMLGVVIVPMLDGVIKSNKNDLYDTQIRNIKSAASNYVSENILSLDIPLDSSISITLGELKSMGYVDTDISDPITGKPFSSNLVILITNTSSGFSYTVCTDNVSCNV